MLLRSHLQNSHGDSYSLHTLYSLLFTPSYCMPKRWRMYCLFTSSPGHPYMLSHMRDIMISLSSEHTPGLSSGASKNLQSHNGVIASRIEAVQRLLAFSLHAFSGCNNSDEHTLTHVELKHQPASCRGVLYDRPCTSGYNSDHTRVRSAQPEACNHAPGRTPNTCAHQHIL